MNYKGIIFDLDGVICFNSYGIGVGLRIDWLRVQQLSEYFTKL